MFRVVLNGRFRFKIQLDWLAKRGPEGGWVGIEIRGVYPSDLAALERLIGTLGVANWSRAQISSGLVGSAARGRVAEEVENPGLGLLGFVIARRITDFLEIDLVGVQISARRQGVARRLLKHLIEGETASGLLEVRLELASTNEPAHRLYEAAGFVVVGRRTRYYPDGADALLLSRKVFPS